MSISIALLTHRLAASIAAILNRPIAGERFAALYEVCRCDDCEVVRARPYECAACGYDGVPNVFPCECAVICSPSNRGCVHTLTSCPVCGSGGDSGPGGDPFTHRKDPQAAAAMIRDLRALLRSDASQSEPGVEVSVSEESPDCTGASEPGPSGELGAQPASVPASLSVKRIAKRNHA